MSDAIRDQLQNLRNELKTRFARELADGLEEIDRLERRLCNSFQAIDGATDDVQNTHVDDESDDTAQPGSRAAGLTERIREVLKERKRTLQEVENAVGDEYQHVDDLRRKLSKYLYAMKQRGEVQLNKRTSKYSLVEAGD
jgi:hypothetical protein